jgi:hypothetical protein
MTTEVSRYSMTLEAFKSFSIGFITAIIAGFTFWLLYTAINENLLRLSVFQPIRPEWFPVWRAEIIRYIGFAPLLTVMLYLVGTVQFVMFALPATKLITRGLEPDAKRSWVFYVTTGAFIGAIPWAVIVLLFGNHTWKAIDENFLLVYPSLSTGLLAGAILKSRLTKLAAASIENSIK